MITFYDQIKDKQLIRNICYCQRLSNDYIKFYILKSELNTDILRKIAQYQNFNADVKEEVLDIANDFQITEEIKHDFMNNERLNAI